MAKSFSKFPPCFISPVLKNKRKSGGGGGGGGGGVTGRYILLKGMGKTQEANQPDVATQWAGVRTNLLSKMVPEQVPFEITTSQ